MSTEADSIVLGDEVIVEGMSIFVSTTGEIAWITDIGGDHIRVETVTESISIPLERFRRRIVQEEFILEAPPAGHCEHQ